MAAKPVRGDIGILVIPEAQAFDYLLSHEGKFDTYAAAMWGAYRGFFDNNIQADWVHIDDIAGYDTLYAPYPISLTAANAAKLGEWVEAGGTLISEACPGYFGDNGHVGPQQPNNGLAAVFGAREVEVEFMPDIAGRYGFELDGNEVTAGGFLQAYEPTTGTARGRFRDGRLAVVESRHGKGRTLLVGTHPSVDYHRTSAASGRAYFAGVFAWTGKTQHAAVDNPDVQVRVHEGDGRTFLWLVNATREDQSGRVALAAPGQGGATHWGGEGASFDGGAFTVPARDVLVVELLAEPAAQPAPQRSLAEG
jgi:beta-galactosidase